MFEKREMREHDKKQPQMESRNCSFLANKFRPKRFTAAGAADWCQNRTINSPEINWGEFVYDREIDSSSQPTHTARPLAAVSLDHTQVKK